MSASLHLPGDCLHGVHPGTRPGGKTVVQHQDGREGRARPERGTLGTLPGELQGQERGHSGGQRDQSETEK